MDVDRLAVLLDLDAYQKQQVGRIFDEQREVRAAQREELIASGQRPSFEDMEAQRRKAQQELFTQLQNLLTAAQIEKLELLMEPPRGQLRREPSR